MSEIERFRGGMPLRGHKVSASEDGDWFQVQITNDTVVNQDTVVPWDTLNFLNRWTYAAGVFTLTNAPQGIYTLLLNTAQVGGVGSMVLSITCGSQNQLMVIPAGGYSANLQIQLIQQQGGGTITVNVENITMGAVTVAGVINNRQMTVMGISRQSF